MSVGLGAVRPTGPMSLGIAATATVILTALQPVLGEHRRGGWLTALTAPVAAGVFCGVALAGAR